MKRYLKHITHIHHRIGSARKNIIALVMALTALTVLLMFASSENFFPYKKHAPSWQAGPTDASLRIDYGNGRERLFIGSVISGMTVLDALEQAAAAGRFVVQTAQGNNRSMWVEVLDGVARTDAHAWIVLKNGADIDGRVDMEALQPGDKIEVRYQ